MLVRSTILAASVMTLAGCDSFSSMLGLERHIPDETQVVTRPPLTLPPDYDLMPPGTPSAVSAEHEAGSTMGAQSTAAASPDQPKPEERGFFGKLFHGDFFGNDVDATTANKASQPQVATPDQSNPPPDVNGTPQAPAPTDK